MKKKAEAEDQVPFTLMKEAVDHYRSQTEAESMSGVRVLTRTSVLRVLELAYAAIVDLDKRIVDLNKRILKLEKASKDE